MRIIEIDGKKITIIRKFRKLTSKGFKIYYEILCLTCNQPKEIIKGNLIGRGVGLSHRACIKFSRNNVSAIIKFKATSYRNRAKIINLEYNLSLGQVENLIFQDCYYCGRSPSQYYDDFTTPYTGIDRVDNKVGYTIENCVPCCIICNIAKKDRTQKAFLNWVKRIYSRHFLKQEILS